MYAYIRRISEARMLTKREPGELFCGAAACSPYHIDTQHTKTTNAGETKQLSSAGLGES